MKSSGQRQPKPYLLSSKVFFPAWLVCLILGILLSIFARWLLLRLKITLVLPILAYPSLAALFTFLIWLIFFS